MDILSSTELGNRWSELTKGRYVGRHTAIVSMDEAIQQQLEVFQSIYGNRLEKKASTTVFLLRCTSRLTNRRDGIVWLAATEELSNMAQQKLTLMISSRSDTFSIGDGKGGAITLRDARIALKKAIQAEKYFGSGLFEVWINEEEMGDYDDDSWNECLKQAENCDLFISLYDGNAGWAPPLGSVGICQAEFDTALRLAPGKVKVVRFKKPKVRVGNTLDTGFLQALTRANRFAGFVEPTWPQLKKTILAVVREQVLKASKEGAREFRKSGGNVGQALDWSRMSFPDRAKAISTTICEAVRKRGTSSNPGTGDTSAIAHLGDEDVFMACHGAPRSLSVSASRELVGQPFLHDHGLIDGLDTKIIGPIHLIGCPKGVTETQAVAMLGFPDFIVVEGDFGIYAADRVQRIQLCLLANCGDPGSARNAVDRFFGWLDTSGELPDMIARAKARRKIIQAILAG